VGDISLRQARADESDALAALFRQSRTMALPYLPDVHTPEEDRAFFRDRVFVVCDVWVAEVDGTPTGFCAFRDGWIDHLYVHPAHQRRGVGAALLRKPMSVRERLALWTFQRNANARRFYETHGFRCVRLTDGHDNEEREPDALYEWAPLTAARIMRRRRTMLRRFCGLSREGYEKGRRSASLFCYRFRRLGTHKPAVAGNSNDVILTSRPCQVSFPLRVQHN
jgi:GNAT superfamily N-acetyltransferase